MLPTQRQLSSPADRRAQRGVFAAALAVLMVPLLCFVALVVDIGRMYVAKTELQNAADACALAAAQQLVDAHGHGLAADAFQNAASLGTAVATHNFFDFQSTALESGNVTVVFSNTLTGGWGISDASGPMSDISVSESWRTWDASPPPDDDWRFARCTVRREDIETWFLQLISRPQFSMSAQAIAKIADPGTHNCGLPGTPGNRCWVAPSLFQ